MLRAIRQSGFPILLIQAENDYDLAPSRALAREMEKSGKPHKLLILPSFGKTAQEAHEFCVRGSQVWSVEVFSFLDATMKK